MTKPAPKKKNSSQKNLIKKLNYNLFLALLLVAAIAVAVWFFLRVNQLECVVDGQPDPRFCQQVAFLKDRSLFFTRFDHTPLFASTLVNDQGQVFEPLKVEKQLPDKLIIHFSKQDPIYKFKLADQVFVVNSQGYLAEDSSLFDLPQVELADSYQEKIKAKKIDSGLHQQISQFIEYFNQQELNYNDFRLKNEQSSVKVSGLEFLFEDDIQPIVLAAKIKLITDNLPELKTELQEGGQIEQVDLRFDLPVVKLKTELLDN